MAIICFLFPGLKKLPISEFYEFSAQISGFGADFHRKSLNIVKQHQNNADIWADSGF